MSQHGDEHGGGIAVDCDIVDDCEVAAFMMPSIEKKLEAMALVATAWVSHCPHEIADMEPELDHFRMWVEKLRTLTTLTFDQFEAVFAERNRLGEQRKIALGGNWKSLQQLVQELVYVLDDESENDGEGDGAKPNDKCGRLGTPVKCIARHRHRHLDMHAIYLALRLGNMIKRMMNK